MGETIDIRSRTGDHLCFARWPHDSHRLLRYLVHQDRIYIYKGRIHGIPTYDEMAHGEVWVIPPELYIDETPIATSRVSESEILAEGEDLPDTLEPPPPSSEKRRAR